MRTLNRNLACDCRLAHTTFQEGGCSGDEGSGSGWLLGAVKSESEQAPFMASAEVVAVVRRAPTLFAGEERWGQGNGMVLRQLEVQPVRNVLKPLLKLAQGSSHDWLWGWSPEKPPHQAEFLPDFFRGLVFATLSDANGLVEGLDAATLDYYVQSHPILENCPAPAPAPGPAGEPKSTQEEGAGPATGAAEGASEPEKPAPEKAEVESKADEASSIPKDLTSASPVAKADTPEAEPKDTDVKVTTVATVPPDAAKTPKTQDVGEADPKVTSETAEDAGCAPDVAATPPAAADAPSPAPLMLANGPAGRGKQEVVMEAGNIERKPEYRRHLQVRADQSAPRGWNDKDLQLDAEVNCTCQFRGTLLAPRAVHGSPRGWRRPLKSDAMGEEEEDERLAKTGPELFKELRRLYAVAEVEDYFKNGMWRDDLMKTDLQLIEVHRREAGAPDPPDLSEVKLPPDLPRGFVRPRTSLISTPSPLAATTVTTAVVPPTGGSAVADLRLIALFVAKWKLDVTRTKTALTKLLPSRRRYVIAHFKPKGDAATDDELESYIAECESSKSWDTATVLANGSANGVKRPLSAVSGTSTVDDPSKRLRPTLVTPARPAATPKPSPATLAMAQRLQAASAARPAPLRPFAGVVVPAGRAPLTVSARRAALTVTARPPIPVSAYPRPVIRPPGVGV
ncbi:unnamed protein product, partial [Symbiodinium sp. CCMP2592]